MNRDNPIAEFVRNERKRAGLTQEEFALRSGLSLSFVRNLEQGKQTLRLDKVNRALYMFGNEVAPAEMMLPTQQVAEDGRYA